MYIHFIWLHLTALLSSTVYALVLQDLPPHDLGQSLVKRDMQSLLGLRSTESFLWGDDPNNPSNVGNLTVFAPSENENILSMERFAGLRTSVNCTNTTIDLAFKDDASFLYAQQTWDWVNGADNHSFVMVAGTGECGWNTNRQPFLVSTLAYDEILNIAHLNVTVHDWKDVVHSYSLDIGSYTQPIPTASAKFRRSTIEKELTIPFDMPIPMPEVKIPIDQGESVTFNCDGCGTKGSFAFKFHLETILFIPKKATISFSPRAVSAELNPRISLAANFTESINLEHKFPPLTMGHLVIPGGIIELGPQIVMSVGVQLSGLNGAVTMSTRVGARLNDNAYATLDLLNPSTSKSENWEPVYENKVLDVSSEVSTTLKAYEKNSLELAAKVFGQGFSAGINLSPYISAKFAASIGTQPVCAESKQLSGVKVSSAFGIESRATVAVKFIKEQPIADVKLWGVEFPLPGACHGFGIALDNSTSGLPL